MLIYSMTGFGRGESPCDGGMIIVEISTLNSRYLDTSVRGLRDKGEFEMLVREQISKSLGRGKVSVSVVFSGVKASSKVLNVNWELARQYYEAYGKLAFEYDLEKSIPPTALLTNHNIFDVSDSVGVADDVKEALVDALNIAISRLIEMRAAEGKRLVDDLRSRFDDVMDSIAEIETFAVDQVSNYRVKLKNRLDEIASTQIDHDRLEQECVIFADRADITEEITRLKSHIAETNDNLAKGGRIGRRLDFLIQELNREINTIGSKSQTAAISSLVVGCKDVIEQIREQAQNIE